MHAHAALILRHAALRRLGVEVPDNRLCQIRLTASGASLVSLEERNPQLGVDIPARDLGRDDLPGHLQNLATSVAACAPPRRPTPEKILQAWLIKAALSNDRILPIPCGRCLFVADEVVLQDRQGSKGSRRVDLLGVHIDEHGHARHAFIELKSSRDAKELAGAPGRTGRVNQLAASYQAFHDHPEGPQRRAALRLLSEQLLAGVAKPLVWAPDSERSSVGIMVWRAASGSRRRTPKAVSGCPDMRLVVVGYDGTVLSLEQPMGPQ